MPMQPPINSENAQAGLENMTRSKRRRLKWLGDSFGRRGNPGRRIPRPRGNCSKAKRKTQSERRLQTDGAGHVSWPMS
jgi:hypothetical protein